MVVFDVGGTLIHFNHEKMARYYAAAAAERGTPVATAQIHAVLTQLEQELPTLSKQRALSLEKESGKSFWDDFYAEGFRRLGIEGDVSRAVTEIRDRFQRGEFETVFDDTLTALNELAARKVPMGIVSNFSPNLEDVMRQQGIHDYFQFFIVSAIAGVEKPDPKIFDLAVDAAHRPRPEIVYVGDSIFHDMDGARGAGLAGILIDRANLFREYTGVRLQDLNDLVGILEKEEHGV